MQRLTIKEWAEKVEAGYTGVKAEDYRIYILRDTETVFYVGQSINPFGRLQEHLGLTSVAPSLISEFIRENAPASGVWLIEPYTLEECSEIVGKCRDVDDTEEALINLYHPYFNIAANPDPAPLPTHYTSSYRDREAKNATASIAAGLSWTYNKPHGSCSMRR